MSYTKAIIDLAEEYGPYGYRRITALLNRECWRASVGVCPGLAAETAETRKTLAEQRVLCPPCLLCSCRPIKQGWQGRRLKPKLILTRELDHCDKAGFALRYRPIDPVHLKVTNTL